MKSVLKSLLDSHDPGLYLLRVGLSQQAYAQTAEFSPPERKHLARRIVQEMKDTPNIQKIIDELVRHEFAIESDKNVLRTGGRLAAEVLRAYIEYHEGASFLHFYWDKVKRQDVPVTDYEMNPYIKTIWNIIRQAAEDVMLNEEDKAQFTQYLGNLSLVFYEQMLPLPTVEQLFAGKLPINLTSASIYNDEFNQKLGLNVEPRAAAPQGFDLREKLINIKRLITEQTWEVQQFLFFNVGGTKFEGKRYPHRIKEILQLIQDVELDNSDIDPRAVYEKVLDLANEALLNPRTGQKESTQRVYQTIVNNRILPLPEARTYIEELEILHPSM